MARFRLLVLGLMLACSCVRPASDELFSYIDESGEASFTLDLADSLDYSLRLYVYSDADDAALAALDSLPLRLDYLSPAYRQYAEDVVLGKADIASIGEQTLFLRTLRSGFRPVTYGSWLAVVSFEPALVEAYRISGVGLRVYRRKK